MIGWALLWLVGLYLVAAWAAADVQPAYASELLAIDAPGGAGYLLKERIGDVEEFADAVTKVASGAAVRKHIGSIFTKLDLDPQTDGHRRVPAVLAYLGR